MANIKEISITGAAISANGIALSQTPGGAGNLTLNGGLVTAGVATLTPVGRVSITSTSNISNRTFTITGTDRYGNAQLATKTGPNNTTVYTDQDFLTVTNIAISGAAAGALTVGTNGIASTQWYPGDYKHGTVVLIYVTLSTGAVLNYTVEHTPTNLNDQTLATITQQISAAQNAIVFASDDVAVVGATTNKDSNFINSPPGIRLTLNSWTSGTATLRIITANNNTF